VIGAVAAIGAAVPLGAGAFCSLAAPAIVAISGNWTKIYFTWN
jgi:hypothetical protein